MGEAVSDDIKRMSIKEFREVGFLQEVNRLFFHPLGLALEVIVEGDTERLGGIWDYREDPEGVLFAQGMIDRAKIERVEAERQRHEAARYRSGLCEGAIQRG